MSNTQELTPREAEVAARMRAGESNATIAEGLGISEGTVKAHVLAIRSKGVNIARPRGRGSAPDPLRGTQAALARKLADAGLDRTEIAQVLRVKRKRIDYLLNLKE